MAEKEKITKEAFIAYMMLNGLPKKEAEEISEWFLFEDRTKGKWVEVIDRTKVHDIHGVETWATIIQCPNCMFSTHAIEGHYAQYKFCPSCGADMRGEVAND